MNYIKVKRLRLAVLLLVVPVLLLLASRAQADAPTVTPAWSHPEAMAIEKIGPIDNPDQARPAFEDNLDCTPADLVLNGTSQTRHGCYVKTAFGGLDIENGLLRYNGIDDKAVPLLAHGSHEALFPWPGTVGVLALSATSTGGSTVGLYRNILGVTSDNKNILQQVTSKQVTAPPDMLLYDNAGNRLTVNANALAFSDNGSWLVVETTYGSFVRINLATLVVTPFAPAFVGGSPGIRESQLTISDDGRYVAIANSAASTLKVYDLTSCPSSDSHGRAKCQAHDYWSFASTKIPGLSRIIHLRFVNDGLLSLIAGGSEGLVTYELAPRASIGPLIDYLAVGDSYVSGEGAYDYVTGTDSPTNGCHLSKKSYPYLLTRDLFTSTGGHSVACSGATLDDIMPSNPASYSGQAEDSVKLSSRSGDEVLQLLSSYRPGYLPQGSFVAKYQPDALSLSVGGNDIGFGNIMRLCTAPHLSAHLTGDNTCYNTYEDRFELAQLIDSKVTDMTSSLKQLRAKAPATRIYVIGYPLIASDTGKCAANVQLGTSEIEFSIEIIEHLNAALSAAAAKAGVNFVDISQALEGHKLCQTGGVAVNGVTAGRDGGLSTKLANLSLEVNFLGKESYHPNAYGHELIEAAIKLKTNNFTSKIATSSTYQPAVSDTAKLLKAPKTNRPITTKTPTKITKQATVTKGGTVPIKLSGTSKALRPNSSFTVKVGKSKVVSAGTVTTDSAGEISSIVTIPSDTPSGIQPITITGPNQLGDDTDLTDIIYVIDNPADYDGDGVLNDVDSCLAVVNSGTDSDQDGIDDACDGSIDSPPNTGTTTGTTPPTPQAGPAATAPVTPDLSVQPPGPTNITIVNAPLQPATEPLATILVPVAGPAGTVSLGSSVVISSSDAFAQPAQSKKTIAATLASQTNRALGATVDPTKLPRTASRLTVPSTVSPYWATLRTLNWFFWCCILGIVVLLMIALRWLLNYWQTTRQSTTSKWSGLEFG